MNLPIREQTDSRAATRLSTAPEESRPGRVPRGAGGLAILLRGWRRLTSMRTALVLLLVLAMAALPGSLLPQQRLNPFKVAAFLRQHPTLGPIYQRLGFFDVFAAPWFAAVYLLLFVSLIGCLIPRLRLHLRALLRRPPAAPSRLDRLPHQRGFDAATPTTQLHAAALALLRRKHWRIRRGTEPAGVLTISAEKGYLRETGNLIFHLALVLLLLGMAIGKLYGYSGTVVVQANAGFCNTVSQFDSFSAGPWVNQARLTPLCVTLKKFSADYTSAGIASQFRADIAYTTNRDGTDATPYRLEVNHPLRRGGNRLYLLGHGFSPQFTIRDPAGDVFDRVSAPFLPQDGNLTSSGVLKLPDARPQQLAIEGVFAPSAIFDPAGRLVSASPVPNRPAIAIFVDRGDLGLDAGQPQSVYSIDPAQFSRGLLRRVAAR
ncbi:MAG: cytochrome c biogenesis protein ResB, partial [Mycobacteriales bacterium]